MIFQSTLPDGTPRQVDLPDASVQKLQVALNDAVRACSEISQATGLPCAVYATDDAYEVVVGPRTLRTQLVPHPGNILLTAPKP